VGKTDIGFIIRQDDLSRSLRSLASAAATRTAARLSMPPPTASSSPAAEAGSRRSTSARAPSAPVSRARTADRRSSDRTCGRCSTRTASSRNGTLRLVTACRRCTPPPRSRPSPRLPLRSDCCSSRRIQASPPSPGE
jgi:hypothetical protein